MPTPTQIKTEITTGPLAAALVASWAAAADQTTADLLNAKTLRGPVSIREMSAYCVTRGITGGVLAWDALPVADLPGADLPAKLQTKGLLKTICTLIQDDYRLETADLDDPSAAGMLDGLQALGVLSADHRAGLLALGANRRSRAEAAWGDGVTVSATQVGEARNNG